MSHSPQEQGREASALGPEALAVLVENHRRFLSFLEARVGSRETAEDILQEAFVRGLTRDSGPRDAESSVAWFYRVLRNAMIDRWRRRDVERRGADRIAAAYEESAPPDRDEELFHAACACVLSLRETLKPEYAAILERVDVEERPIAEAADEFGITANNATVRLHRARRALRERVMQSCGTCAEHGCLDCGCRKGAAG